MPPFFKLSQYPRNADGSPMDVLVGVLTDSSGNGGARLSTPPVGPDNAPFEAKALVIVDSSGNPIGVGGSGGDSSYPTVTALADVPTPDNLQVANLTDVKRAGTFIFIAQDFTGEVAADPQKGIYIAPTGTTGSTGAWVRQHGGSVTPFMFGAIDATGSPKLSDEVVYDCLPALNGMWSIVRWLTKNRNFMVTMDMSHCMGLGVNGTWVVDGTDGNAIWNRPRYNILGGRLVAMSYVTNLMELSNGTFTFVGQMDLFGGTDTQLNSNVMTNLFMEQGLKVKNIAGSRMGDWFIQGAKLAPIGYDHFYDGLGNNNIPTQWGRIIAIQCGTRSSYTDVIQGVYTAGTWLNQPADNGQGGQKHRMTLPMPSAAAAALIRPGQAISFGDYTTSDTAGKSVGIIQDPVVSVVGTNVTVDVSDWQPIQTGGQFQLCVGGLDLTGQNLANNTFEMTECFVCGVGVHLNALFAPKFGSLLTESVLLSLQLGGVVPGDAQQGVSIEHYHMESVQWGIIDYGTNNPVKLKVQSAWCGWDKVYRIYPASIIASVYTSAQPAQPLGIDVEVTGGFIHMLGGSAKGKDLGGLTNGGGLAQGNHPQDKEFETVFTQAGFSVGLVAEKALANVAYKHRNARFRVYGLGTAKGPTGNITIGPVYYQPEVSINGGAPGASINIPPGIGALDIECMYEPPADNGPNGNWTVIWSRMISDYVAGGGAGPAPTPPRVLAIPIRDLTTLSPIALYDTQQLAHMWQDTAGTVAAVVGQPVARVDDLSGHGWHQTQGTAGSRPILVKYGGVYFLDFDGVDDYFGSVGNPFDPDLTAAQPWTSITGVLLDETVVGSQTFFCGILTIAQISVDFSIPQFILNAGNTVVGGTPTPGFHAYAFDGNGAASNFYVDNVSAFGAFNGGTGGPHGLNIGASNGPNAYMKGLWSGQAFYPLLSATNRKRVTARMLADASI
jgi:hypothetical protein